MAKGTTALGGTFMVKLGDGGSPEVFTLMGGFKTKKTSFAGASKSFQVMDNDNPDAAVWDETIITSLSLGFDADGLMEAEFVPAWDAFFQGGTAKNLQLRFSAPVAIAGKTYSGSFVCTKVDYGAPIQDKITISISLKSAGDIASSTT